jgi:4-amino-4-deoxy-L-arabinose transferase-like glycosyltransferase
VAVAWHPRPAGDAVDYVRLADGLADGRGYVDTNGRATSWRPPGYPVVLAAIQQAADGNDTVTSCVEAVLGTITVALIALLAGEVLGPDVVLAAGLIVALDPAQLALTARRLSEGPFTLLLSALLLAAALVAGRLKSDRSAWGLAAASGVLAAAATLTRGLFVFFPLALAAGWILGSPRSARGRAAAAVGALLLAYGLALLPWTLRNVRALGEPVPVATQGGLTLYASWFPPRETLFGMFPDDDVTRSAVGLSEPEQSSYFVRATLRKLRAAPWRIPRLIALKALYLVSPLDWEVLPFYGVVNPVYLAAVGWAITFFVLAGLGRRAVAWPLWLPLAYVAVVALVFYGSPRMRAPVDPLIEACAAAAIVETARRRGTRFAWTAVAATVSAVAVITVGAAPLKALALGGLRRAGLWRT